MEKIFGINPTKEALRAGILEEVYVDKYVKNKRVLEILELSEKKNVKVNFLKRSELTKIFGTKHHQGVGGLLKNINLYGEDQLIEEIKENSLYVLLDGITDQHNLGAILRSCAAFGVDGVFIPKRKSASFSEFVWKTSAGAILSLKISFVTNLSRTIDKLKENFVTVIGADAGGEVSLFDFKLNGAVGVVFGSEGKGMRRLIRKKCDYIVSIPILNVESLNVSVSAGIFLYEISKQRRREGARHDFS